MQCEELVTTAEVSRRLGVSENRLGRAVRQGRIPEPRRVGGQWLWSADAVACAGRYFTAVADARRALAEAKG